MALFCDFSHNYIFVFYIYNVIYFTKNITPFTCLGPEKHKVMRITLIILARKEILFSLGYKKSFKKGIHQWH
ncbi:hypothetical protein EPIR_3727 [Erwinia piriflorinigrans CFBP 5888]|uniref:Uncharacterized protein n=1 Tax=Erwinia piriflorinigrans CFBP 5888 TaxID=1161919 RepID=V5ZCV4_9GAMM|nr:hypothetical protein EPIR_3727 [Erwinia piriflorinigrans CFBP 5888]